MCSYSSVAAEKRYDQCIICYKLAHDHGQFSRSWQTSLSKLIHLSLFLSIEVGGDEHAGSKLEPQRTMVPTIARWKMRVGVS